MFAKKQRLTKSAFDTSFKRGKRIHSPELQLIFDKGTPFHGAAVVGKKVHKRAVDRNRLRRQLYGALYRLSKRSTLTGTFILIAKPGAKTLSKKAIPALVEQLVTKTQS